MNNVKIPPIFISGVDNIKPLTDLIEGITNGQYEIKVIGSNQVKVQLRQTIHYSSLTKELQEKKTEFHSFQYKNNRSYRAVIRNLHPTTDVDDLKTELMELGHEVLNIFNVKQGGKVKRSLPLFMIDLKTKDNNKEIHELQNLMHTKISVEKPKAKRVVVQCMICQRYGHTKKYCSRSPRCVKCAGDHHTEKCEKKIGEKE